MIPSIEYVRGSITICVCMAESGVVELFICDSDKNAKKYINILKTALIT